VLKKRVVTKQEDWLEELLKCPRTIQPDKPSTPTLAYCPISESKDTKKARVMCICGTEMAFSKPQGTMDFAVRCPKCLQTITISSTKMMADHRSKSQFNN